ncbi:hypothetical protein [uncultured Psychrobacter sp.]|jgi:DNA primase|uniref:hypothetical protein n=1 Tax=uncultured Psychrobacter sp. TaxID=259303 RepID=UPI0025950979|nr:hypothetical protein [uncultured Psychrobacter sp.]
MLTATASISMPIRWQEFEKLKMDDAGYTADHLLDFLTRQTDKDLMADLVKGFKAIES